MVMWLVDTATVTTQGSPGSHDTANEEWGLQLAKTGDSDLATSGDFFMATDTRFCRRVGLGGGDQGDRADGGGDGRPPPRPESVHQVSHSDTIVLEGNGVSYFVTKTHPDLGDVTAPVSLYYEAGSTPTARVFAFDQTQHTSLIITLVGELHAV